MNSYYIIKNVLSIIILNWSSDYNKTFIAYKEGLCMFLPEYIILYSYTSHATQMLSLVYRSDEL